MQTSSPSNIGARIKRLRKIETLTQRAFAEVLGISRGYLPLLEKGLKTPSEQLLLSISRAFGANLEWLKEGKGAMYAPGGYTEKGRAMIEQIYKGVVAEERERYVPLRDLDAVLKLPREYAGALHLLLEIFKEGNKRKIDAIMAQLQAFKPEKPKEG